MVPPASDKIPRVSPYSGCSSLPLPISPTGLSPSSAVLPFTFGYLLLLLSQNPFNPISRWFGLLPFRSPLLGESLLFSSPPGTWMFQFPGYLSLGLSFSSEDDIAFSMPGSPIRTSACLRFLTARRRFSQFGASFFSFEWPGILRTPLPT